MEKGFRGDHFEHISVFEGERQILSGITGYVPDFECVLAGKRIISIFGKEWSEGMKMVTKSFMCAPQLRVKECSG